MAMKIMIMMSIVMVTIMVIMTGVIVRMLMIMVKIRATVATMTGKMISNQIT